MPAMARHRNSTRQAAGHRLSRRDGCAGTARASVQGHGASLVAVARARRGNATSRDEALRRRFAHGRARVIIVSLTLSLAGGRVMNSVSLAPSLLLSMPQLVDPNFNRTVVLLCKHSDDGAFGLVVNRPLVTTGRVVVNLDPPVSPEHDLQVWVGGPVEPQRSWILVGDEPGEHDGVAGVRIAD